MVIELSLLKGLSHAIHTANLWRKYYYDLHFADEETEK